MKVLKSLKYPFLFLWVFLVSYFREWVGLFPMFRDAFDRTKLTETRDMILVISLSLIVFILAPILFLVTSWRKTKRFMSLNG